MESHLDAGGGQADVRLVTASRPTCQTTPDATLGWLARWRSGWVLLSAVAARPDASQVADLTGKWPQNDLMRALASRRKPAPPLLVQNTVTVRSVEATTASSMPGSQALLKTSKGNRDAHIECIRNVLLLTAIKTVPLTATSSEACWNAITGVLADALYFFKVIKSTSTFVVTQATVLCGCINQGMPTREMCK